uniref:Uncharacterized protein n=1 Tax=Poecilia reticulata TaxID=8081 RepID=A0A3P9MVW0_POERE
LSLTSITFTCICNVPDLPGIPPSTAVRMSFSTGCFSLSKAFSSTNTLSRLLLTSIEKYSFGLILKVLTELMSLSAS